MHSKRSRPEEVLHRLEAEGGLAPGVAARVHRQTGVPEADVYGVASFYSLLRDPQAVRVCDGLSCRLHGAERLMADLQATGTAAVWSSCLGRCDMAPALWNPAGEPAAPRTALTPSSPDLAIDLAAPDVLDYRALAAAAERGAAWVIDELEASGITGRGGAGFPAHVKWRGVAGQAEQERYVVLNADEGEPGTFKDREVMLRRPHRVIAGLAVAALALAAQEVWIYVRGEFGRARRALEAALAAAREAGALGPVEHVAWHFADGHGAYICGEETALLESLEGKRGMPRMKPPFPVAVGFRGKPTLIQNVETIACVPAILERGGAWFRAAGRTEPGTKLYCLSGHVARPGVYEAPLGITLVELLEQAGGVIGRLKAFSPGGASSGFLPAERADVPLDFASLAKAGSMLGSAGIVVLNDATDMVEAALAQALFFEEESCGQCSPCRIGTRLLRRALERYRESRDPAVLAEVDEVSWGMGEASICGLGQAAFLPLASGLRYFPEEFGRTASNSESGGPT
ncbi:MAG TPA: NADH-ubiquinone oxidoreductase-F iron-sulfur binding region domain-containing protein [Thermoanaerobaculia bacterium]|nr:NADH-ubiquinone oxidoreductase-F iron-sulfur binding region domain-containing protein [Thermoanaerobaculia bacterium]